MEFFLLNLISSYGVKTLIICAITTIINILLCLLLKKLSVVKNFLPFIIATLLELIYDCVFVYKQLIISADILYSGIMAGGLSIAINVFIKKLKNGKSIAFDKNLLMVIGLLDGVVSQEHIKQTAEVIISEFNAHGESLSSQELSEKITHQLNAKFNLQLASECILLIIGEILKASDLK